MGQRYRTRERIIYEILTNIAEKHGEVGSTELMYKVFLSHYQLKEYLKHLTEVGLVTRNAERSSHIGITERGRHAIQLYEDMNAIIVQDGYDW